jgi:hypothetical protein
VSSAFYNVQPSDDRRLYESTIRRSSIYLVGLCWPTPSGFTRSIYPVANLPARATGSGESSRRALVLWRVDFLLQTLGGDFIRARGLNLQLVSIETERNNSGAHTFFKILSPSCSATAMAFLRELACSMRSLIDDPVGQVYTKTTTSDPG